MPAEGNRRALIVAAISLVWTLSGVGAAETERGEGSVNCERSAVFEGAGITVWTFSDQSVFFFEAGMAIDADGSPNAYHPDDIGLDELVNAGQPGRWWGVVTDTGRQDGDPVIQGALDPAPGYYVSRTALEDWARPVTDPLRYVDAETVPYIVLPADFQRQRWARLGDFAIVINRRNGKRAHAIFADIGPDGKLGEGSIALAQTLGIRSSPRYGGARGDVFYLVFPGSNRERTRSVDEIQARLEALFAAWGGMERVNECLAE